MEKPFFIVDSHQDIAWNASLGRDFLETAQSWRARVNDGAKFGERLVTLPDLLASPVRLVIGTIFVLPARAANVWEGVNYSTPAEAHQQGQEQLDFYVKLAQADERITLIRDVVELDAHLVAIEAGANRIGLIISMEGADPITRPSELSKWVAQGLRLVGPAWKSTSYCGGTGEPGPPTPSGYDLLAEMQRLGVMLDISHMAEQSFYNALDVYQGTIIASHSNCRHFVNTDRQLSDDMLQKLIERDGVIGVVLYDNFLRPREEQRKPTLDDVIRHISRICDLAGGTRNVALGTDWDGGFGGESIPAPLTSLSDLPLLGEALLKHGWHEDDIHNLFHANWIRVLRRGLANF